MELYKNKITNTDENITEEDILRIENRYSFKYPLSIREHYLNFNGGTLERYIYVDKYDYEYAFNYFIPIKYGNCNLEFTLDCLRVDEILPDWVIPFANDPGGDLFCFSLKQEEEGAIYYWSHEYEDGENPENHICYLAESLKTLIDSMIDET